MCETCQNWARVGSEYTIKTRKGVLPMTNHHANCPHFNDSLMDVFKVKHDGQSCYLETEQEAEEVAGTEANGDTVQIIKEKMHREIFENLPEFEGF